jgi:hypothetical protein
MGKQYRKGSTMSVQNSIAPEQQWYQMIGGIVSTAIQVVETLNRAKLVFEANDLQDKIDDATVGYAVGSSTMTKEQAQALTDLITTFATYLNTPMVDGGLKPIQVLYRQWQAPLEA